MTSNPFTLSGQVYWWPLPWGKAHVSERCVAAFMENPARYGVDRMRASNVRRTVRDQRPSCPECWERFVEARIIGAAAHAERQRGSK